MIDEINSDFSTKPSPAIQPESVQNNLPQSQPAPKKNNGLNILTIIVGALFLMGITGFGVWAYMSKVNVKTEDKITETKPESTTLTEIKEEESKTDETAGWKTYVFKSLGVEFKLPPQMSKYGEMKEEITKTDNKATVVCLSFPANIEGNIFIKSVYAGGVGCNINIFGLSTTSKSFADGRMSMFSDYQGFIKQNDNYYPRFYSVQSKDGLNYNIQSDLIKVVNNPNNLEIIRIIGKNSSGDENGNFPIYGTPGEGYVGALVNISNNQTYTGFAVQMELKNGLTIELFDQILSTFKFTDTKQTDETAEKTTGTVTGKLCYPSEMLPKGEIVAKEINTQKLYTQNFNGCSFAEKNCKSTYAFKLNPGKYYLRYQAHASGKDPDAFISGYYTNYVKDNTLDEDKAESHVLYEVLVKTGETVLEVDLCDFYYQLNEPDF